MTPAPSGDKAPAGRSDPAERVSQDSHVEEQALETLLRGDREGVLELLMDTYGGQLFRYCVRMMKDREQAQDVHQTVFVQAFQGLARFEHRSSFRTWLYRIAHNRCLDALKAARRRGRWMTREQVPGNRADPGSTPEQSLLDQDLADALRECMELLPNKKKTVLLLRFQEQFTYPQMAAICSERSPTLQARVARTLPQLRRCLEGRGISL